MRNNLNRAARFAAARDNVASRVFVPVKGLTPEMTQAYERVFGLSEAQNKAIEQCKPERGGR